jgi:ketosteroid isomerase-like protein
LEALLKRVFLGKFAPPLFALAFVSFNRVSPGAEIAKAQPIDRAAVVDQFFSGLNAGDLSAATAAFSEDALLIGGRSCTPPNTCYGRAAIAAGLSGIVGNHLSYTLLQTQTAGSVVFGQYQLQDDATTAAGVDRIIRSFLAEVPSDRMTAFISQNDLTDAQTAQFLGIAPASSQVNRQGILDAWFQARSTGDVQAAAAGFTDDAVLVSAPPCDPATPCVGADLRSRLAVPAQDVNRHYTGSCVVIEYEQRGSALAAAGIDRIVVATIVQMPDTKMSLFVRMPDLTDAQTASNAGVPAASPS